MTPLAVGSPEARAVYRLLSGDRLVRLDPACADPVASAITVVGVMAGLAEDWYSIDFLIANRGVREVVKPRLVQHFGRAAIGVGGRLACIAPAPRHARLFVVGFEPDPWPGWNADTVWFQRIEADQVLVVGPQRDWENDLFPGLVRSARTHRQPWCDQIPLELLLAGDPS